MSIVAAENAGIGLVPSELQLGDSWRGIQSKMSVVAPVKKIRKKSDNKPQSQINKCYNEKKRRELENDTINQLEELLGACLSDVRQPDKNGIVQEASQQIRHVLERRRRGTCSSSCPLACRPLQLGDVSSTLSTAQSEVSALVESLKHFTTSLGWVLLEINLEGDIECVTENIRDFVRWERTELHRQSIYNYLHHGDHHKLLPVLQGDGPLGWGRAHSGRLRAVRIRLLIKPDENPSSGEESARYAEVLLSACLLCEVEQGSSVLCVIRREEEPAPTVGPPQRSLRQLTVKLDGQWKILRVNGLKPVVDGATDSSIEGRLITDLTHPDDTTRILDHLRKAAEDVHSPPQVLPWPPVRIRFAPNLNYIAARPQSRWFLCDNPNEVDFMLTNFTVLSDVEMTLFEPSNNNYNNNNNNNNSQNPPVGGPLMTSAIVNGNGGRNGQYSPSPASESFTFPTSELDLEYCPQPTWHERMSPSAGFSSFQFSPLMIEDHKVEEKPTITNSGPPTPRTPHTPAASTTPLPPPTAPTPPESDSARLRNLLSIKRESPASTPTPISELSSPNTPATSSNAPTGGTSSGPSSMAPQIGSNLILKTLLIQEDEEEAQGGTHTDAPPPPTPPSHPARPQGSNMLLQLLNDKSDEEDPEQRNIRNSTGSELLSQLLKEGSNNSISNIAKNNSGSISAPGSVSTPSTQAPCMSVGASTASSEIRTMSGGEGLLHLLGRGNQGAALKRKFNHEEQMHKRPHSTDSQQVSSSGHSKLRDKNKMLAQLLERQPSAITRPPALPNPHLNHRPFSTHPPQLPTHNQHPMHPTHQQHRHPVVYQNHALANLLNNKNNQGYEMGSSMNSNNPGLSPLHQMLQNTHRSAPATPTGPTSSNEYRPGGAAFTGEDVSDPLLSEILDQVMDIEPDYYTQDHPELMSLIAYAMEQPGQQAATNQQHHNSFQVEKMAINRIEQSLMQCETAVKGASSPGVPPAYPSTTQSVTTPWPSRHGPQAQAAVGLGAPGSAVQARHKALAMQQAQQKARLLQAQQQQLVVGGGGGGGGPSGAPGTPGSAPGTPTSGQSMDALLNAPTPPNVSLQRASDAPPYSQPPPPHYHHHHHHHGNPGGGFPGGGPTGQEAPPYKLTLQQQQNPMLNAQLTQSGYSGQRDSPLAPHTPLTPHTGGPLSPYPFGPPAPLPRMQRHLSNPSQHPPAMQVGSSGGYYVGGAAGGEAGGPYGGPEGMFLPPPHPHHPHHPQHPQHTHQHHNHNHHGANHMSGMTSEYVRQELRAVVGARTSAGGGGGTVPGGGGGARPPDHLQPPPPDLESLGLSFEMPPSDYYGGGQGR